MKVRASLAAAAVLTLAALVVRADRQAENGLVSLLFPQTQAYETVDYSPPRLPPLRAVSTPAQAASAVSMPTPPEPVVAEVVPAYQEASAFPAVPDLADAPADELVALNALRAQPQKPVFDPPELAKLDVLDSDAQTPEQKAPRKLSIASFEGAPCDDACNRDPVAPVKSVARFERVIANPDIHWRKLLCSRSGAYRYELVNDGDAPYTRLTVYNGGQRWDVGTLDSHQTKILSSPIPFGRQTIVNHDPHFDSSWSQPR